LFAGCPDPRDTAVPKKIAIAKILASSPSDINFHPSIQVWIPLTNCSVLI
jgi:hypothetical protein